MSKTNKILLVLTNVKIRKLIVYSFLKYIVEAHGCEVSCKWFGLIVI